MTSTELRKHAQRLIDIADAQDKASAEAESILEQAFLRGVILTDRQRQVLQLVRNRKVNKEIAGELNVSVRTVKFHVTQLMNKLGVRERHAL